LATAAVVIRFGFPAAFDLAEVFAGFAAAFDFAEVFDGFDADDFADDFEGFAGFAFANNFEEDALDATEEDLSGDAFDFAEVFEGFAARLDFADVVEGFAMARRDFAAVFDDDALDDAAFAFVVARAFAMTAILAEALGQLGRRSLSCRGDRSPSRHQLPVEESSSLPLDRARLGPASLPAFDRPRRLG
jgi:hypothetical protein